MPVGIPSDHKIAAAPSVTIYNVTLTLAGTEYPQPLPTNTRKFALRPRTSTDTVKAAFTSGESGSNYITVDANGYYDDEVAVSTLILYMQSSTAGAVVEIVAWS